MQSADAIMAQKKRVIGFQNSIIQSANCISGFFHVIIRLPTKKACISVQAVRIMNCRIAQPFSLTLLQIYKDLFIRARPLFFENREIV